MTEQEMIGLCVLVHPLLWDDPAKRCGQIGRIVNADSSNDDFEVQFDDESTALYSSNALIMAKSADRIYDYAVKHEAEISHNLRQVLADYATYFDYYGAETQKSSLKLVQSNDELRVMLSDPLEDILEKKLPYKIGR